MFEPIYQLWTSLSQSWQTIITSTVVSIVMIVISHLFKYWYGRLSLNYKIQKEYYFKQRVSIKEKLSESKTPLIKASEELNYRLWNLSENIHQQWHNVDEAYWTENKRYYLQSFVYRFLVFIYWINRAEYSLYSFDLSQADSRDQKYLKYIKTLKHFFCESNLLKLFKYDGSHSTNHFYKDNLVKYANYVEDNGVVIDFDTFVKKFKEDHGAIKDVVLYITNINKEQNNLNYNIIKSFHLFLMLFLNKYGLDYHYTSNKKFKKLYKNRYKNIQIKNELYDFFKKNKVAVESIKIVKYLDSERWYRIAYLYILSTFKITK